MERRQELARIIVARPGSLCRRIQAHPADADAGAACWRINYPDEQLAARGSRLAALGLLGPWRKEASTTTLVVVSDSQPASLNK